MSVDVVGHQSDLGCTGTEMSHDLRQVPTAVVVQACETEATRFICHEPARDVYARELLRRALYADDVPAWEVFTSLYRGSLLAVIRRYRRFGLSHEDDRYWVDRTMERFWRAISRRGGLSRFSTLSAIIVYLKMCANSVVMDEVRARGAVWWTPLDEEPADCVQAHAVERDVLGDIVAGDLWRAITCELRDEAERVVAYFSFVRDLSPREIHDQRPDCCPTVEDVYRVKRNLLDRLRRSASIQAFHNASGLLA